MTTLLLVIIYIAFISLGLPDAILGSAWPIMYEDFHVPISYVGMISMLVAGGTIISSLFSDKLMRKLGTGKVTALSVALTAVALMGFSFSNSFWTLCIWALPYGLGAGSVDAALNNFVALNYKSRHMSWLHCFWGVGATVGPYIMGLCLTNNLKWNIGYRAIGILQIVLVMVLVISLPLWKVKKEGNLEAIETKRLTLKETIKLPGAKNILLAFFAYCSLETTTGLWASSYMVLCKGINAEIAAKWAALFYLGITVGRFVCGFITDQIGNRNMVRIGQGIASFGILIMLMPLGNTWSLIGLMMIGIGCAPIYPSLLHETPRNFGKDKSQAIMGMQMASAYVGTTFMPPLFGIITQRLSIRWYPWYLLIFVVMMFIMVERVNILHKKNKSE